jgi:hypothetical protein
VPIAAGKLKARHAMLTAENEAAEILRRMRLKAHTTQRGRYNFRWLFELLGWRYPDFPPPGRADDPPTPGLA